MSCPFDYSMCRQTVTRYRLEGSAVSRQVLENVCFRCDDRLTTGDFGPVRDRKCELTVPGEADLRPGDRIFCGVGPEEVDWNTFLPVNTPGLAELNYATPWVFDGEVCHTRAGRR